MGSLLRPTPGFGAETLIYSYVGSSVEYDRSIRGNGEDFVMNLEAIGLSTLGFIMDNGRYVCKKRRRENVLNGQRNSRSGVFVSSLLQVHPSMELNSRVT